MKGNLFMNIKNKNFIISKNFLNMDMILVKDKNIPILFNEVISKDGAIIDGGRAPHKPSSEGFVWIKSNNNYVTTEYYPSVFNLKWVDLFNHE